jgi:HSP20 family protein
MKRAYGSLLEVARIQSEINRLFDHLLDLGEEVQGGQSWTPNVDVCETQDSLVVLVELPGVDAARVSLSVRSGNLVVEGDKPPPEPSAGAETPLAERMFGPFRRVIPLGAPVNTHQARAVLKNGLLRLCFPKVPNRRGEVARLEVTTE